MANPFATKNNATKMKQAPTDEEIASGIRQPTELDGCNFQIEKG